MVERMLSTEVKIAGYRGKMVPPSRFERLTFSLGGNCSILLSYGGSDKRQASEV